MKRIFVIALLPLFFFGNSFAQEQEVSAYLKEIPAVRTIENCNNIVSTAEELKLGFPFNDAKRLRYNGFSYIIGKRIDDFQKSLLLEESKRANSLHNIIDINWKRGKKYPIEGMNNFGALQDAEREMDVASLLASFVVAEKTGEIVNIVPYLEFVNVYFGSKSEALPGLFITSFAEEDWNSKLTIEQRQAFWPASQAILKHPEVSVPLLFEALENKSLHEVLRLRAAGFLKELDRGILDEALPNLEDWLVEKINCMIEAQGSWSGVTQYICEDLQRYKEHIASQPHN